MRALSPLPVLGSVTRPPLPRPIQAALCFSLATQHQYLFLREDFRPHLGLHPDSLSLTTLYTEFDRWF